MPLERTDFTCSRFACSRIALIELISRAVTTVFATTIFSMSDSLHLPVYNETRSSTPGLRTNGFPEFPAIVRLS
jgi:hypothetical protein